ncbi:MAG: class I SAM-dependent methyltransferase [Acidobacteriota bacterium]
MFHPEGPTFFELARQALSSTERGYDLLAPKFERTPFKTPDALLESAAQHLARSGRFGRALDLCCGTGAATRMLRPLCDRQVVGIDFSHGMLSEARRLSADSAGTAELRFLQANVLDPNLDPTLDGSFDLVTCFGALGHFVDRQQPLLVQTIARLLAPGGRFVFATADRPSLGSPRLWLALGFNAAMAVRNTLWRPPFVMYYLSFLLPRARQLLEAQGFHLEVHRGICDQHPWAHLVVATSPGSTTS